ncbi:MAG: VOC family protein [Oscillospiraceae bacterium]|nr:VOC family protein [Oscillospiraceae bacterium]
MNKSTVKGLHHVALNVNNLEKAIKFYEALGMTQLRTWGEAEEAGAMLDMGDGSILEMFANGDGKVIVGVIGHFALDVDDVDAAYRTALEAGATPDPGWEPMDIVIGSQPPYPARVAFVFAPTGERVEFFQVK